MPARPVCSICGLRPAPKFATIYWAETWAGVRTAWKQRFCPTCFATMFATLREQVDRPEECIQCRNYLPPAEYHTYWATIYTPHNQRIDGSLDCHYDCRDLVLKQLRLGSELLPNRADTEGWGGGPPSPAHDPWAELGDISLDPTER